MIVALSRRDREDLRKIFLRLAIEVSPSHADRTVDLIEARCRTLESMPERGAPIGPLNSGLRHLIERHYLIVYDVSGDRVTVVTVLHGRRDVESELRDLAAEPPA